jgi:hypothetical protein
MMERDHERALVAESMMDVAPNKAPAKTPSTSYGPAWPPSWDTKPHGISIGRYIDPTFQRLEYEKLWSKVWQVAARVDEQ